MLSPLEMLGIIAAFAPVLIRYHRSCLRLSYPPGPPRQMFIGTLIFFSKMTGLVAKDYGPIIRLRFLSKYIIILSSAQAVFDLLDKRAEIHSGQRTSILYFEMLGREL
ncbi:hypothetical protein PUNSTDRAFT_131852 [Punctularia strigosozonata HHB-11173 SS5]|uniref:uncharacterized protein n=1 Tax=Punctularia strigosozonata (strain HHB-11173) TaxID=741275 RepID=UPI000441688C|nr:uncharacterized protein PUNSTDRAFT_131852 [Punctularia strigosozonata HHB-11173 SS5]EIN11694.1 hypothetical protein PUNSTDRAFT_131852 [Punctularia strigosozonata HHB-11173 SS5]